MSDLVCGYAAAAAAAAAQAAAIAAVAAAFFIWLSAVKIIMVLSFSHKTRLNIKG